MTITNPVPQVPTDLPVADLDLDDIEHVLQILIKTGANLNVTASEWNPDPGIEVEMLVGTKKKCDQLSDLPEITTRPVKEFELEVSRGRHYRAELRIRSYGSNLQTRGLSDAEARSVFQLVEGVFKEKKSRWRTFARAWIGSNRWWSGVLDMMMWAVLLLLLFRLLAKWLPQSWAFGVSICVLLVLIFSVVMAYSKGSTIIFRRTSEQQVIAQRRKEKIFWEVSKAVLYILAGIVVGIAAPLLLHRYWPSIKL